MNLFTASSGLTPSQLHLQRLHLLPHFLQAPTLQEHYPISPLLVIVGMRLNCFVIIETKVIEYFTNFRFDFDTQIYTQWLGTDEKDTKKTSAVNFVCKNLYTKST